MSLNLTEPWFSYCLKGDNSTIYLRNTIKHVLCVWHQRYKLKLRAVLAPEGSLALSTS